MLITGFVTLLVVAACHNYYKATPGRTGTYAPATLDSLRQLNRHFILRHGTQALYMTNMVLSADQRTLTARLDSVPPNLQRHLQGGRGGSLRYKAVGEANERDVLSEVHLYTVDLPDVAPGENFSLPLDRVQKIEILEKDRKRTTNSYVLGAIGYTLGAFAIAAIIIAATKSSCPFVSAYDGNNFALQGEIYGGAIYPQLARHDYLPLKMAPLADGSLQLKISNELKEVQYTDMADLWVVTHEKGTAVYPDEQGHLYSVSNPQPPLSATLNGKKDLLLPLQKENDQAVAYLDDTTSTDAGNTVLLQFKKEKEVPGAKLVLTLKNSYFLDLLYGELANGFGSYYETYLKKQSKKPAAELQQWINAQQLPLSVSVRTKQGWKKLTDLTTVGPLAYRTLVVPVDTRDVAGDKVDVKLSSGFMFWELDYAALDVSAAQGFSLQKLSPAAAIDEQGQDVLALLQKEDNRMLEQPQVGNVATLTYKPSGANAANREQTCFLHVKGWYRHVRHFQHGPNVAFLKQFLKPGAFPAYGKVLYQQVYTENLRLIAAR